MQLLISSSGDAGKRLDALVRNVSETRVVLAEVAEIIAKRNAAAWGRGVHLAESTIEQKQREGYPDEPIVETGGTKKQLTDAAAGTKLLTDSELVFGSDRKTRSNPALSIAYLQQHGTRHMPKHRVLRVTPATRRLINAAISAHLVK
jgi:hypothetical protein